jgi:orotate phosphoribosyltransferase
VAEPAALVDPLARQLFDTALLRGTFTLRSGATSDRYFDKYRVTSEPRLLGPIAGRMGDIVGEVEPDAKRIVAPELGAVPLAVALSLDTGLPYAIVRGSGKEYGTSNRIEGPLEPDDVVVLLEDVVTSGGAVIEALQVARAAGMVVNHVICVLDRDGGGREALAELDVELHALLTVADLDAAFEAGLGQEQRS